MSDTQNRANALNVRMQGEAGKVLDDIDRTLIRKVARESFACALACYDKAGATGPSDQLERCARTCQVPHQQAANLVQNEVAQFQNRLNRNMQECQEKSRDMLVPGDENNPTKMAKVENALIDCMSRQVDEHIKLLQPMKQRIASAFKNYA